MKKEIVIFSLFMALLISLMNLSYKYHSTQNQHYYVFDADMNTTRNNSKSLPGTISKSLHSLDIRKTNKYTDAHIIFTHKLDDMERLSTLPFTKTCRWIYGLRSVNMICSKSVLALVIRNNKHINHSDVIPQTYILSSRKDYDELIENEFNHETGKPLRPLLLKQNIQRQNGLTFVKSTNDLTDDEKISKRNVVCQVLLTNPYLVDSRKINMRIYLLVICDNRLKKTKAYIYNDGFMYYTREYYSQDKINHDTQITTGYIDRAVYEQNPLTVTDFMNQKLTTQEKQLFRKNLYDLFKKVMQSYEPLLNLNEYDKGPGHFIILGCDIAPDNELNIKILEINKGPDLSYKDKRDEELKYQMVKTAFNAIHTQSYNNINNYTQVL
jgi:hypothetical protein